MPAKARAPFSLRLARNGAVLHLVGGATGVVALRALLHQGHGDGKTLTRAHVIAHMSGNMLWALAPITANSGAGRATVETVEWSAIGAAYLNWLAIFMRGVWTLPPPGDLFEIDPESTAPPGQEVVAQTLPKILLGGVVPLTFICSAAALVALRRRS